MEIKNNRYNRSKHHLWGLVLGISVVTLLCTFENANAAARQAVCHIKPKCPFDVFSAGFDNGHLSHGDPQGRCNSCGNGVRECCAIEVDETCQEPTEISTACCTLDTPLSDPTNCTNSPVPGCTEEECDDGDNDCNTNDCTGDCKFAPDCDDSEDCTADSCTEEGICVNDPKPDDTECEDGDLCSEGEICKGGECVNGEQKDCDDDFPDCAVPRCEAGQCLVDLSDCDCLTNEECDDDNDCTMDVCGADNKCDNNPVPNTPVTTCDDGNEGTSDDHCEDGVCVACGNLQKDNTEECDGEDFAQCAEQIGCNSDCTCRVHDCGNGTTLPPFEQCDVGRDGQSTDICKDKFGSNFECRRPGLENECMCIDLGSGVVADDPGSLEGSGPTGGCSLIQSSFSPQHLGLLLLISLIPVFMLFGRMQKVKKRIRK